MSVNIFRTYHTLISGHVHVSKIIISNFFGKNNLPINFTETHLLWITKKISFGNFAIQSYFKLCFGVFSQSIIITCWIYIIINKFYGMECCCIQKTKWYRPETLSESAQHRMIFRCAISIGKSLITSLAKRFGMFFGKYVLY